MLNDNSTFEKIRTFSLKIKNAISQNDKKLYQEDLEFYISVSPNSKFSKAFSDYLINDYVDENGKRNEKNARAVIAMQNSAITEVEWKIVEEAANPNGEVAKVAWKKLHTA